MKKSVIRRAGSMMKRGTSSFALLAAAGLVFGGPPASGQSTLPIITIAPTKTVGRTPAESAPPEWPAAPTARSNAPNVLVIMTDDVGFGSSSTFGGPVPTPTLDALAVQGLRYNQFNTTALCSPTRAALLTGRNEHNAGMGNVSNLATGYDGYTSVIPKSTGMISETLRQNGYSTAAIGKWHLTPQWETSRVGPFDHWPNGQGFEYYYGFLDGDTDQFSPALVENTLPVAPPVDDPSYILDKDLANHAISWLRIQHELAPTKPFFMYYATGSAHSPHSAPQEWLARFRGKFDQGWDVVRQETFHRQKQMGIIPADTLLTPRPSFLPAWASLSADRKLVYARQMEAYAAALAFADHEIGRVIESLRANGELENTMIIYVQGDNGSSAEGTLQGLRFEDSFINGYQESFSDLLAHVSEIGGPREHNHYSAAWAWAMNAPFQYYKQVASHFGGVRNGLVVSWPGHLQQQSSVRQQFLHITDIVPTILDAVGVEQPAVLNGVLQKKLDGIDFSYTFANPTELSHRRTQVFEMMQNLGIYHDGWVAGTHPAAAPWDIIKAQKIDLNTRVWELYHITNDYSEFHNLAASEPAKLEEMKQLFFAEAAQNNILPIHGTGDGAAGRPSLAAGRSTFTFYPGLTRVPENAAPHLLGHSYSIAADVVVPNSGANGVMVTEGGRFSGYSFYLKDGKPVFFYNATAGQIYAVRAPEALSAGEHSLEANFTTDSDARGAGGMMVISVDGKEVARGRIEHTHTSWISLWEGFDVGEDTLTPINDDYTISDSRFSGTLKKVVISVK